MQGAAVEQRRRRTHEVEARNQVVELDGPAFPIDFIERQPHGDAHEENLRQLDATAVDVQEIAVVQGLQAEVAEQAVALRLQRGAQALEVVVLQARVEQFGVDAAPDEGRQVDRIVFRQRFGGDRLAEDFGGKAGQQQAGGDEVVAGFAFDERTRRQNERLLHVRHGDAIIEVLQRMLENQLGGDIAGDAGAGGLAGPEQDAEVERVAFAVDQHMQCRRLHIGMGGPFGRPPLAVEHVGPGDVVLARAHQRQFDLVLNILDMHRAAIGQAPGQRAHDDIGQPGHDLPHARGHRALAALDGEESLGHGDRNLLRVEIDDGAVTADDLQRGKRGFATGRES